MKQDLVCEYQGHRRGRKRKHASETTIETNIARPSLQKKSFESDDRLQLDPRLEAIFCEVDSGTSRAPVAQISSVSSTAAPNSNEAVIGDADQSFGLATDPQIDVIQPQPPAGAYGTFMLDPSAYYPYEVPSSHPSRQASPIDDIFQTRLPTAGPSSYNYPPTTDVRSNRGMGFEKSATHRDLDTGDIANTTTGLPVSMQDFAQSAPVSRPRRQEQVPPQSGRGNRSKAFEIKFSHVIPDEGDSSRKIRPIFVPEKLHGVDAPFPSSDAAFLPPRKTGDQPVTQTSTLERSVQPQDGLDPIRAGILHEIDVEELFRL